MRVLLTTDTIGGVWTFTREFSEYLLADGHAVALLSFGRLPDESQAAWCASTVALYPDAFLYEASDIALEWMQENQTAFTHGAEVIANLVAYFHPDILHSSQFCWGALSLGVPVVITAHSDVMSWAAATKPQVLQGSRWLTRYRTLVQQGLCLADAVVAPTAWMRDALQVHFYVPPRMDVIYNGRTVGDKTKIEQRKMRAISVGRLWDEAKGLRTLLEANSEIPVAIAGEDRFETAFTSPMAGITTLGLLSQEELLQTFRESRIYVATSLYEPFGLAPLEAGLCGCAVVARDLESLREIWGDGALYFHDAADLEALLHELAVNDRKLQQAESASTRRAQLFTAERMATGYLALYERLTAPRDEGHVHREEITAHAL